MAEESSHLSSWGLLGKHYEEVKEHWRKNFAFLDYYKKTLGRAEPLPKWTDADVEEFIASDPVYGPQVSSSIVSRSDPVSWILDQGSLWSWISNWLWLALLP